MNEIGMSIGEWDGKKDIRGWYMSEKLDGQWARWDGKQMLTGNGNIIHAPKWWTMTLPTDCILDGELYMGIGKFQETQSVVRSYDAPKEQWLKVGYVVFDRVIENMTWIDRITGIMPHHPMYPMEHTQLGSPEQMVNYYNTVINKGGEGIIVRNPKGLYQVGRSQDVLKIKPEHSLTAEVTGYIPGEGNFKGLMGAVQCKAGDIIFKCGSGFTMADRTDKHRPPIGSIIKVKYTSLTDGGKPRFPRYGGRA